MILLKIMTALILQNAQASMPKNPMFCNVSEFVGSSFDKDKQVDSTNEKYGVSKTRVWFIDDLKNGVTVSGTLLPDMQIGLDLHEAITWDSSRKEIKEWAVIAKITDVKTGASTMGRSHFVKTIPGADAGLYSLVSITEPNLDKVEISCAKSY